MEPTRVDASSTLTAIRFFALTIFVPFDGGEQYVSEMLQQIAHPVASLDEWRNRISNNHGTPDEVFAWFFFVFLGVLYESQQPLHRPHAHLEVWKFH
jgi:hypothetical protein